MRLALTGTTRLSDPELDARHRLSRIDRFAIVALFVPFAAMVSLTVYVAGVWGTGHAPVSPIGRWLGRGGVVALPLDFLVVLGALTIAFLFGVPTWRRSAWRYLGGTAALGILASYSAVVGDVEAAVPVLAIAALGLIVGAVANDRP